MAIIIQSVQQERVLDFSKTIRDFKMFFFLNKSTLEGLRRYYLIDSPVPIVVQNGCFWVNTRFHASFLFKTLQTFSMGFASGDCDD